MAHLQTDRRQVFAGVARLIRAAAREAGAHREGAAAFRGLLTLTARRCHCCPYRTPPRGGSGSHSVRRNARICAVIGGTLLSERIVRVGPSAAAAAATAARVIPAAVCEAATVTKPAVPAEAEVAAGVFALLCLLLLPPSAVVWWWWRRCWGRTGFQGVQRAEYRVKSRLEIGHLSARTVAGAKIVCATPQTE